MDQAIRPVSWQTSSQGDGRGRSHGVFVGPRRHQKVECLDAKPGAQRGAVSLWGGAWPAASLAGHHRPGPTSGATAGGAVACGGHGVAGYRSPHYTSTPRPSCRVPRPSRPCAPIKSRTASRPTRLTIPIRFATPSQAASSNRVYPHGTRAGARLTIVAVRIKPYSLCRKDKSETYPQPKRLRLVVSLRGMRESDSPGRPIDFAADSPFSVAGWLQRAATPRTRRRPYCRRPHSWARHHERSGPSRSRFGAHDSRPTLRLVASLRSRQHFAGPPPSHACWRR